MTIALTMIAKLQKGYGTTPAELETLVEGYAWLLDDQPVESILAALREYVRRASDIPRPADVLKIIAEQRASAERQAEIQRMADWRRDRGLPRYTGPVREGGMTIGTIRG